MTIIPYEPAPAYTVSTAMICAPNRWCVAGGWAAHPPLATDMDVWAFGRKEDRTTLLETLRRLKVPFIEEQNAIDSGEGATTPEAIEEYNLGTGVLIWKVARLDDGSRRHIILTNADDERQLLDNFDVSTHQVAITDEGQTVYGRGFTPLTVPPVALLNNAHTPARMAKISERYRYLREAVA